MPRHVMVWRNKWLTAEAETVGDMAGMLAAAASELRNMADAGVILDARSGIADDYAVLVTDDAGVARRYGFTEDEVCEGRGRQVSLRGRHVEKEF